MKKFILSIFLLSLSVGAQTYDFNKTGNIESNKILKEYIVKKFPEIRGDVISYFADIDEDNKNEIIGIMKTQYFYSLSGYKLLVLKKENGSWDSFKSDVYFDIANDFEIKNKKITFYKMIFYKNKKYTALIKKDKIKTQETIADLINNKKAHNIEEITKFSENHLHNDFELENFHAHGQKNLQINYTNLDTKTKHYLNLK